MAEMTPTGDNTLLRETTALSFAVVVVCVVITPSIVPDDVAVRGKGRVAKLSTPTSYT